MKLNRCALAVAILGACVSAGCAMEYGDDDSEWTDESIGTAEQAVTTSSSKVWLYTYPYYMGYGFGVEGVGPFVFGTNIADKALSARVTGTVALYDRADGSGRCLTATSDIGDLGLKAMGGLISSVRLNERCGQTGRPTFFEHANYEGRAFVVPPTSSVSEDFIRSFGFAALNKMTSSIKTGGRTMAVFSDVHARGRCSTIGQDTAWLGDMNDTISSAILGARCEDVDLRKYANHGVWDVRLTLFTDAGFGGAARSLAPYGYGDHQGSGPSDVFSDPVTGKRGIPDLAAMGLTGTSSISFHNSLWKIALYSEKNYKGECVDLVAASGDGITKISDLGVMNDRVASLRLGFSCGDENRVVLYDSAGTGFLTVRGDIPDLRTHGFNDKTASINFPGVMRYAAVYEGVNYTGRCETIRAPVGDAAHVGLTSLDQYSAVAPGTASSIKLGTTCRGGGPNANLVIENLYVQSKERMKDVRCPSDSSRIPVNLNEGSGGNYIYACVAWGPGNSPITDIHVTDTDPSSGEFNIVGTNLDEGAGALSKVYFEVVRNSGNPLRRIDFLVGAGLKASYDASCKKLFESKGYTGSVGSDPTFMNQKLGTTTIHLCKLW